MSVEVGGVPPAKVHAYVSGNAPPVTVAVNVAG